MINLQGISLNFSKREVFNNFSLEISKGEKLLLAAPSGKGKSTLLKIIMGFVKPDAGRVFINNQELTSSSVKELRQLIAYLPQEIHIPKMQVEDFIKSVLNYQSNHKVKYDKVKLINMLEDLKLPPETLEQSTDSLSGGERQRVAIIIMQLLNREIFLLDEITSALNSELKNFIVQYFMKMQQTIIVVSHDEIWHKQAIRKVEW
jgi:putative ABC transport system ATP-binding protein